MAIKRIIYLLVLSILLYSCTASSKDVIQFKNMPLYDYYYIDDQTKILQCYGGSASIVGCYSLDRKEKLWEFFRDKLAYDECRYNNYMYNSFDGNVLLSLKEQETDENNICVVDTFSGNVLKKLDISGYVYYTVKDGNYLYAVMGVDDDKTSKDESDDVLIIKIDLLSFKHSILFKVSDTGQSMEYKSDYLKIGLPLIIVNDMILFYTYYSYIYTDANYCLYAINKNNGNICWKRMIYLIL